MITKEEILDILITKDSSVINFAFDIGIISFNEKEMLKENQRRGL